MFSTRIRALLLAAFLTGLTAYGQTVKSFSFLHTNDLHAHLMPDDDGLGGFAYLKTVLDEQRRGCTTCLYLNAGDFVQGTPVSTLFRGDPIYQIANHMGIDVSTIGNHEFDYGWKAVQGFDKTAKFPMVSANIVNDRGELLAPRAYVIKTVAGVRIAIIGAIMADLVGNLATEEAVGPWHVIPVVDAVKKAVADVKGKADMIVVLGHIQIVEADAILHQVPEVNIVVAGHDHKGFPEPHVFEHRWAVEGKSYGVELSRLDFDFDTAKHEVVSATWKHFPIDSRKITPDPEIQAEVNSWEAKVSKIVDVPIGEAKRRLQGADLRVLIQKAMADATGADIGYINSGNVRGFLPQGQLLARHVWNVLPFDNYILVGTFKGSELPAKITNEFKVDPDKTYRVATTDFTVANQAAPSQLGTTGLKFPVKGPLQRDAMIEWIRNKKVIE